MADEISSSPLEDDCTNEQAEGNASSTKPVDAYNSSHDGGFAVVSGELEGEDFVGVMSDSRKPG